MMRKTILIAGALLALAQSAGAQVLAPEDPTDLDPLTATQEGQRPLVVLRGTMSEAEGIEITQTEIVVGLPPQPHDEQVSHSDRAVQIDLLNRDSQVVESVAIDDPRVVHELEGEGETYLRDQADFTITIPLEPDGAEVRIQEVELGAGGLATPQSEAQPGQPQEMIASRHSEASVNLSQAVESFCTANQDERVCP